MKKETFKVKNLCQKWNNFILKILPEPGSCLSGMVADFGKIDDEDIVEALGAETSFGTDFAKLDDDVEAGDDIEALGVETSLGGDFAKLDDAVEALGAATTLGEFFGVCSFSSFPEIIIK